MLAEHGRVRLALWHDQAEQWVIFVKKMMRNTWDPRSYPRGTGSLLWVLRERYVATSAVLSVDTMTSCKAEAGVAWSEEIACVSMSIKVSGSNRPTPGVRLRRRG